MKGYQSFKTDPPISFEEFLELMAQRWNQETNGVYTVGKPHKYTITSEEFVLLPATGLHMIIVRPRKKKITLTVCPTTEGAQESFNDVGRRLRRGFMGDLGDMITGTSLEKDRSGPAEEALQFYTARMKEMLADYL